MSQWNDFNTADDQTNFDVIPKGTIAKVRMTLQPGGFDEPSQGWTGGYATRSESTEAVYLSAEFVVVGGPYAKRKLWSLIGLYSPKGPEWSNMGRTLIKGMLNSARGLDPKDTSTAAQQARRIQGFADLDGLEFVAKIDIETDQYDDPKNIIKLAITPEHKHYAETMGTQTNPPSSTVTPPSTGSLSAPTARPSWAQ